MHDECPLCRKLAAPPAEEVVWEFPHSVAFLGPWQFYRGYCVLVAREHRRELFELHDAARRAYLDEMTVMARAIAEAFEPRKINYELLGNQVPHLHWHLFPRRADDPNTLQAVWLSLARAEVEPAEKARLHDAESPRGLTVRRLRNQLASLGALRA